MRRFGSLVVVSSVVAACVVGLAGVTGASAASTLPSLNLALSGKTGIRVSGSEVSGAVNVTSTFSGKGQGEFGLVRLNTGVQFEQAFQAVQSHHGDINALTPFGSLFVDASAPGTIQTALTPGNYVALNITGNGQPAFEQFTVTQSSSPASLPAARATEASIEFGFKGPKVLRDGSVVRVENDGFLVHMDVLIGARNRAGARKIMALQKAGKDHKAQKLATAFLNLLGPASPGRDAAGDPERKAWLLRPGLLHGHPGRSRAHTARHATPDPDREVGETGAAPAATASHAAPHSAEIIPATRAGDDCALRSGVQATTPPRSRRCQPVPSRRLANECWLGPRRRLASSPCGG